MLVALVALVLAAPVVWLELDSPPEPPVSALADLPDDALVTAIDKGCGSGGCWLEVSEVGPTDVRFSVMYDRYLDL